MKVNGKTKENNKVLNKGSAIVNALNGEEIEVRVTIPVAVNTRRLVLNKTHTHRKILKTMIRRRDMKEVFEKQVKDDLRQAKKVRKNKYNVIEFVF